MGLNSEAEDGWVGYSGTSVINPGRMLLLLPPFGSKVGGTTSFVWK
jgi:hypothetical protein